MARIWPLNLLILLAAIAAPSGALASCGGPATEADAFARADVVFEGAAQPGPGGGGQLADPIRFQVIRVLKGDPSSKQLLVNGGTQLVAGGIQTSSVALVVQAGEVWRIYATRDGLELAASECSGSLLLGHLSKYPAAIPERIPRHHSTAVFAVFAGIMVTMIGGYFVGRRLSSRS